MPVHVIVDPDACIGSAECVALGPEAVELDEHGTARMLVRELEDEGAKGLCDACPIGALSIGVVPESVVPSGSPWRLELPSHQLQGGGSG